MSFIYHPKNPEDALRIIALRERASSGDVESQYEYGHFLIYDSEAEPKEVAAQEGFRWLKSAAEKGHAKAIQGVASILLRNHFGVPTDNEEGMRLSFLAAEMGSREAIETLAYHFSYDDNPELIKGYAYFRLSEYSSTQCGFSPEIAADNISQIKVGLDQGQLAEGDELFASLRDKLEMNPHWRKERDVTRRSNDRDRYTWLLDRYAEVLHYADGYPEEFARIKGMLDEMESRMNKSDMAEIRMRRAMQGLPNSPDNENNHPASSRTGCLGIMIALFVLPAYLYHWSKV